MSSVQVPLLEPASLVQLPKGQAFALLEGGQLRKLRIPLPDGANLHCRKMNTIFFRYDWMRLTRRGSSAAISPCRCTDVRTCTAAACTPPRTNWLARIVTRRADWLLPRRMDAGDSAGVAGRGVFMAEHLHQPQ